MSFTRIFSFGLSGLRPNISGENAEDDFMPLSGSTTNFRRLLLNAVLIPLVSMLIIASILVWQIERLEAASAWVEHSDRVIAEANELQKLTLDLETGLRGYLLTGNPAFLEPYNNARAVIDQQAFDIKNTIVDNPGQQALLAGIDSIRASWLNYAQQQLERKKQGSDTAVVARAGEGKAMMDLSRARFRTFIRDEESLRDVRSQTARRISTLTLWLTGAMALLVGGVLAFMSRAQFIALTSSYDVALKTANDLNVTLENRVTERTQQLERRSTQLVEANQELEAFGYSISHDLRAPMRHISGFVDLIRKTGAHFEPEIDALLATVSSTARLAGKMVDDLLSFSRVGRVTLRLVPVELNPIIDQCIQEVAPDLAALHVEWVITPLPLVQGDTALLKMALQNLISNAVKYTSKTEMARIEIGVSEETATPAESPVPPEHGGMVTLFIRDNGIGFDMQYAQKLFGVFQRLHRAEEFDGTGIGLANVQRIILRHGGRIWARSELGRGTTFYFTLPTGDERLG